MSLLDLRSLEEGSASVVFSYTGTGGLIFDGVGIYTETWAYAVASGGIVFDGTAAYTPVVRRRYFPNRLESILDASDIFFLNFSKQLVEARGTFGSLSLAVGPATQTAALFSNTGYPNLVHWPNGEYTVVISGCSAGLATTGRLAISVARVTVTGTLIEESPLTAEQVIPQIIAPATLTFRPVYAFSDADAGDRFRIKFYLRSTSLIISVTFDFGASFIAPSANIAMPTVPFYPFTFGGVATTTTGTAAEEEDSRSVRRRFAARAVVSSPGTIRTLSVPKVLVTTSAHAPVTGLVLALSHGTVRASASSLSAQDFLAPLVSAVGTIGVVSDATASVTGLAVSVTLAHAVGQAESVVTLTSVSITLFLGRVSVLIGPDLIAEEDDDLLFLLEVA
jgi:hypothetical protein